MKVLVTGGAGFIGRSLVRQLAERGHEVVVLDSYRFSDPAHLFTHPSVRWEQGDVRDPDKVREVMRGCDVVAHLAAPSSFIMHEEDDLEATSFTVIGGKNVLERALEHGIKKIVFGSTSAVYEEPGKKPRVPFQEDMPINPPDSKAGWKWAMEMELARYRHRHGFKTIIFRPFSVYGVGEESKLYYANITSLLSWAAMEGEPLTVWGDGSQTRDFIYVEDAARAHLMAIEEIDQMESTVLNLGFGVEHSFLQVVDIIVEELGIPMPQLIYKPIPIQIYAHRLLADTTKIQRELGFKPRIELREGIRRIIAANRERSPEERKKLSKMQNGCDNIKFAGNGELPIEESEKEKQLA